MPGTAVEHGLTNPFEPIHALAVAGRFLRGLFDRFGNLGLAAAAYNAGPGRVSNWMAKRGPLPRETRNYVMRITGREADHWAQAKGKSEDVRLPAKAPCLEVAEAVQAQARASAENLVKVAAHAALDARTSRRRKVVLASANPDEKIMIERPGRAAIKARARGRIKTEIKTSIEVLARSAMRTDLARREPPRRRHFSSRARVAWR